MKAKDLRNSILQMAVQGKLVPQDPTDEPASVLLERIRAERAQLIKEKKIKAPKGGESVIYRASDGSHYEKRGNGEAVCIDDEIPFEIPESWAWCRFGSICTKLTDGSHNPPPKQTSGYPVISAMNIKNGGIDLSLTQRFADREGFEKENPRTRITKGDIILGIIGGSIGNAAIYQHDVEVIAQRSIAIIETLYLNEYSYWAIQSPLFFSYYSGASGTAQGGVYLGSIADMLLPVPPMAEQKRIASRIGDLLKVIDDYGVLEDSRERLDAELPDRLRKSILQLAVRGKLVMQAPADEPASALLDRIRAERAALVKAKKLKAPKGGESVIYRASDGGYYEKRGKDEPVCIDDEIPFEIPESWEWTRLQSLISRIHYGYTSSSTSTGMIKLLRITDIQSNSVDWDSVPYCSSDPNDLESFRLQENDVLIARTGGTIGKSYVVRNCPTNSVFASYLIRVIFQKPELVPFVAVFMDSPLYWNQLNSASAGTGQPNVNTSALSNLLLAIPPAGEQKRIAAKAGELLAFISEREGGNA